MCTYTRLRAAAAVCGLVSLGLHGMAISQEHSQLVETGVILSAQQVGHSAQARLIGATPPFWTPTPEDIAQLEARLRPYLETAAPPEAGVIVAKLESYKRQYIGYTRDGKKWILVNSFCEEFWRKDDDWRDRVELVYDGGPCFFKLHYEPSSSQFERLWINGEA